jgi:hypothetical protein
MTIKIKDKDYNSFGEYLRQTAKQSVNSKLNLQQQYINEQSPKWLKQAEDVALKGEMECLIYNVQYIDFSLLKEWADTQQISADYNMVSSTLLLKW